jgi:hypothetical protein
VIWVKEFAVVVLMGAFFRERLCGSEGGQKWLDCPPNHLSTQSHTLFKKAWLHTSVDLAELVASKW